MTNCRKESSHI